MMAQHQQKAVKCTHARLDKHLAAVPDRGSITVVWLALSLAQLHSLITHLLSGQDVDKTFKPLNPRCINMDNMHIVNVLILGRGGGLVFDAPCISIQPPAGVCPERQ